MNMDNMNFVQQQPQQFGEQPQDGGEPGAPGPGGAIFGDGGQGQFGDGGQGQFQPGGMPGGPGGSGSQPGSDEKTTLW